MDNIYKRLANVQQNLKAPKGNYNSFGKYKYRSCEDILEAVKPLLFGEGLLINIKDEMQEVGGRIYVKATATIFDVNEPQQAISTQAFAREEETKKGMDGSQVTGAASSYARKYALNGLFAIDDTKDSDATNTHGKEPKAKDTSVDCTNLIQLASEKGYAIQDVRAVARKKFSKELKELTEQELATMEKGYKDCKAKAGD